MEDIWPFSPDLSETHAGGYRGLGGAPHPPSGLSSKRIGRRGSPPAPSTGLAQASNVQNTGEGGVRWSAHWLPEVPGVGGAGYVLCSESMPGGTQGLTQDHRGQTGAGSPDLATPPPPSWHWGTGGEGRPLPPEGDVPVDARHGPGPVWECRTAGDQVCRVPPPPSPSSPLQIGRASCRERV